ncbi:MAG: hypothetical protein M3352_05200, partial [Bacteroidota bacterium]|nr:hypothetical protein [Bacteroidota bacterium]
MKYLFFLTFIVLFNSCNQSENTDIPEQKNADYDLVEIDEQEADSMNIAALKDTVPTIEDPLIQPTAAGRGASERQWRDMLKNVFQTYTFKHPVYLGVSNRKGIGTIMDKNQEIERVLSQMIDENIYKTFLTESNSGALQALNSKKFNFNLIINANGLGVDGGLEGHITRADSSKLLGGNWEIYDLVWGTLKDSINAG